MTTTMPPLEEEMATYGHQQTRAYDTCEKILKKLVLIDSRKTLLVQNSSFNKMKCREEKDE